MWENDCLSYPRDFNMVVTETWQLYSLTALLWGTEIFWIWWFFADGFLKIILHIHAGADNKGFIIPTFSFSL